MTNVTAFLVRTGRLVLAAVALPLMACNTGAYPLDVFPEMHYQRSYRPLEPERLTPPDGAVPVTGAAPVLTFVQARGLSNPIQRTTQTAARAEAIYQSDCATCHGVAGDGQGPMAAYYAQSPAAVVPPVDLAAPRVRARTDGELWWIIGQGLGNMPAYRHLLSDEERWLTVQFIREVQAR
ncbi:MAG: cytochrome c [Chloroflexota bacterium]